MKLRILEGTQLYEDGRLIGPLELDEGECSEQMVIIEAGEFTDIREVELSENEQSYNSLQESKGKAGKGILLAMEGRFQMSDTKNANKRVYPDSIWERTLKSDSKYMSRCRENKMLGECDHPKDGATLLNRVSHMVTEMRRASNNPKEILGRLVVFDTEKGRILKAIHEGGGRLGVSSRGKGSVVKQDGYFIVQGDFDLDTFDVVHNPSTPGAYPTVTESTDDQQVNHQENTDMSKQLQSLQETLTRLMKHEVSTLDGAALGVIAEEVETVKSVLTTESFGDQAPKAAVMAVEAVNYLTKLGDRKSVLETEQRVQSAEEDHFLKADLKEKKDGEDDDDDKKEGVKESLKAKLRPRDPQSLKETLDGISPGFHKDNDANVYAKDITAHYRLNCGVEGKLTENEAAAIQERADSVKDEQSKLNETCNIKATIYFNSLNEQEKSWEFSATSEADLRRSIEERIEGRDTEIAYVEIDRSESIYKECADRFEPLIESQILKTVAAAQDGAQAKTDLSEMSAKLTGAAQIIENLAARVRASDGNLDEVQSREIAAVEILEAIVGEFQSERLKGTVAGIAATHQVDGLAERLVECSTPQDAIVTAVQHLTEHANIIREPLPGARETRIDEALIADAAQRTQLDEQNQLPEKNTNKGGNSPMVEAKNRVVDRMRSMGGL